MDCCQAALMYHSTQCIVGDWKLGKKFVYLIFLSFELLKQSCPFKTAFLFHIIHILSTWAHYWAVVRLACESIAVLQHGRENSASDPETLHWSSLVERSLLQTGWVCTPIWCDSNDVSHVAGLPSNGELPIGTMVRQIEATYPMNTKRNLKVHTLLISTKSRVHIMVLLFFKWIHTRDQVPGWRLSGKVKRWTSDSWYARFNRSSLFEGLCVQKSQPGMLHWFSSAIRSLLSTSSKISPSIRMHFA